MACLVTSSVPTLLKRTTISPTWPSALISALAVCSSALVGESTWSITCGLSGPWSQAVVSAMNCFAGPASARLPLPASITSTALEGAILSGK